MSPNEAPPVSDPDVSPDIPGKEISGRYLLIGLVVLAFSMSGVLWVYWYLHTKPFVPLQRAVTATFPKSYPQVQGGQRRMHKDSPKILRITLRVKFDPEPQEADEQVTAIVNQLEALARKHIDYASYEQFEIHLIQMQPEHAAKKRTITRDIVKSPDSTS